jgi:hypothetical protein
MAPGEMCPHCGLRYEALTTGLTFNDVKQMLWTSSEDSEDWVYRRRGTVLGKWYEYKQTLWKRHLEGCAKENEVPF